jgi:chemotaxis methyl-accepting protein methylase
MSEQKDKTPEQVSDEDYKVAPTSADKESLKKHQAGAYNKEQQQQQQQTTSEDYQLPTDTKVKEELREGVE